MSQARCYLDRNCRSLKDGEEKNGHCQKRSEFVSRGCRSQALSDSACRGWLGLSSILLVVSCADASADAGAILTEAASLPEVRVEIQEDRWIDPSEGPLLESGTEPTDTLQIRSELGTSEAWGIVSSLRVVGDRLFVSDRISNPLITVVNWRTGEIVDRFGRRGEGPGEFLDPSWVTYSREADGFWVFDYASRRFSHFVPTTEGGEGTYRLDRELRLLGPLTPFHPVWTPGGVLTNGFFPDYTLLELDPGGNPVRWITARVPVSRSQVGHPQGRARLNRTRLATDPGLTHVALVYQSTSRIDFFDMGGRHLRTIRGPRDVRIRYRVDEEASRFRWEPENRWAYVDVDATASHVYGLWCGATCPDHTDLPTRVHVFTWEGGFIREFALDRPVKTIAVSSEDDLLFGYSEEPFPTIHAWVLGPLKGDESR